MVGIYAIISPSKRIYIGQSIDDIKARWKMHKQCRKSGCTLLNNSIKKYGFDSHELKVLYELPKDVAQEVINEYELLYWQQYKDCGFRMLNLMTPGNSAKHSDETKTKISESLKGNKYAVGYKHTEDTKRKISLFNKGKKRSVESVKKGSLKRVGKSLSAEHKLNISNGQKGNTYCLGRKMSDESKKKMRDAAKGKIISEETRRKISESCKGINTGKRSPEWIAKMVKGRWGK